MSEDNKNPPSDFSFKLSLEEDNEEAMAVPSSDPLEEKIAKDEKKEEVATPPPSGLSLSLDADDDQAPTKSPEPAVEEKKTEAPISSGLSLSMDSDEDSTPEEQTPKPDEAKQETVRATTPPEPEETANETFDLSLNADEETETSAKSEDAPAVNTESTNSTSDTTNEANDSEDVAKEELPKLNTSGAMSAFARKKNPEENSEQDENLDDNEGSPNPARDPNSNEVKLIPSKRKFSLEDLFHWNSEEGIGGEIKKLGRTKIFALIGGLILLLLLFALKPGSSGGRMEIDLSSPETIEFLVKRQKDINAPKEAPVKVEEVAIRTWKHKSEEENVRTTITAKTKGDEIVEFSMSIKTAEPRKLTPEEIVDKVVRDPWMSAFHSSPTEFFPISGQNSKSKDKSIITFQGTGDGRVFIIDDFGSSRIIATYIVNLIYDRKADTLTGDWRVIHGMNPEDAPKSNYAKRIAPEEYKLYYLGKIAALPEKTAEELKANTEKQRKDLQKNDKPKTSQKKN